MGTENTDTDNDITKFPILELAEMELADGQWCVVSADPAKPLTEEQAQQVSIGYQAMAQILAGKV
jgi:hypothetical protein